MHASLVRSSLPLVRIFLIAALTLLVAGWNTCSGLFVSCQTSVPQPQITALSPGTIPGDTESVMLTVDGGGFVPQSQILWNGSALQTTFIDSGHLQATVTQQTIASLGGSSGSTVKISVRSEDLMPVMGCPIGGDSAALILDIK
jgi:hypothetical protein